MKRVTFFGIPEVSHFETPLQDYLPQLDGATSSRYEDTGIQIVEEFINYHQVLIYRIQFAVSSPCQIPLNCGKSDYHLLYPVQAAQDIKIHRTVPQQSQIFLKHGYSTYAYFPKATLTIDMLPGTYLVYGLVIDIGLIREVIYKDHHFLSQFRKTRLLNKKLLYQSAYWPIKDRTLFQIGRIETIFFTHTKNNEGEVVKLVYEFFEIAEFKQFETYEMLHEGERLAMQARRYVEDRVNKTFTELEIGDITALLGISPQYLARMHKKYFKETLLQYRDKLLVAKAKKLLGLYDVAQVSNYCGFKQQSSFSDYFFLHAKVRPIRYKEMLANGAKSK